MIQTIEILPNALAIPNEYFTNPTSQTRRDFVLAPLSENIFEQLGCVKKNILVKYNVLKRNRHVHKELMIRKRGVINARRAKNVLNQALYHADIVIPCNLSKKSYRMLVSFKDEQSGKMLNCVATINLESQNNSEYIEVVDWFVKNDENLQQTFNKASEIKKQNQS